MFSPSIQRVPKYLGYQQFVGLAAATNLTIPAGTAFIEVQAETQAVRYAAIGSPTATVGMPLAVGVREIIAIQNLAGLQFIEQAPSATLNVAYYGWN